MSGCFPKATSDAWVRLSASRQNPGKTNQGPKTGLELGDMSHLCYQISLMPLDIHHLSSEGLVALLQLTETDFACLLFHLDPRRGGQQAPNSWTVPSQFCIFFSPSRKSLCFSAVTTVLTLHLHNTFWNGPWGLVYTRKCLSVELYQQPVLLWLRLYQQKDTASTTAFAISFHKGSYISKNISFSRINIFKIYIFASNRIFF